jgi:hypothetical protein
MIFRCCKVLRITTCRSLTVLWFALACAAIGRAQDEVQFYDQASKSIVTVQANIEQESGAGLRLRTSTRSEPFDVRASDLVDVVYSVPGSLKLILARARNEEKKAQAPGAARLERLQAIAQAIKEYEDLLHQGQLSTLKSARRHWQFRVARLRAHAASEDPGTRKKALAACSDFLRDTDSWQSAAATRLLASCLAEAGDFEALAQVARQAINRKGLAPASKREQTREFVLWDCLGKNVRQASASLATLRAETPPGGSEMFRLQALEAFRDAADDKPEKALGQLENLDKQAKELGDSGFLWLLRGFCESYAGRDDQALWAFLRVDQLYGQDRVSCSRAVAQLVKLFEQRSDWAKAAVYRAKLWRDFAG